MTSSKLAHYGRRATDPVFNQTMQVHRHPTPLPIPRPRTLPRCCGGARQRTAQARARGPTARAVRQFRSLSRLDLELRLTLRDRDARSPDAALLGRATLPLTDALEFGCRQARARPAPAPARSDRCASSASSARATQTGAGGRASDGRRGCRAGWTRRKGVRGCSWSCRTGWRRRRGRATAALPWAWPRCCCSSCARRCRRTCARRAAKRSTRRRARRKRRWRRCVRPPAPRAQQHCAVPPGPAAPAPPPAGPLRC